MPEILGDLLHGDAGASHGDRCAVSEHVRRHILKPRPSSGFRKASLDGLQRLSSPFDDVIAGSGGVGFSKSSEEPVINSHRSPTFISMIPCRKCNSSTFH